MATTSRGRARERLVATAAEAFYRHGITTSGVDTISSEAGVSKPTLYAHFRSKSELVAAALRWQSDGRRGEVTRYLDEFDGTDTDRILAVFDWAARSAADAGYRGCAFLNATAELTKQDDLPARTVAREHKDWWARLFTDLAARAGLAEPERLGAELLLLLDGAHARLSVTGDGQPMRLAMEMAVAMIRLHEPDGR
jgi:AcrR family transcriptional regulator